MLNLKELEDLRTKEELINYFKALGKNITEEEIEALKKSYNQAEENGSTLTLQQLDSVAGGLTCGHIEKSILEKQKVDAESLAKQLNDFGRNSSGVHFIHAGVGKGGSVNFILEDWHEDANGITITKVEVSSQGEIQLTGKGADGQDVTLSVKQLGGDINGYSRNGQHSSNHNIFSQGEPGRLMNIEQFFNQSSKIPTGENIPSIPVAAYDHKSPNTLEREFLHLAEMAGQRKTDGYKPGTFSFNGEHGSKWVNHFGGWDGLIEHLNKQVPESNILNKEFTPSTSTWVEHFFKSGAYKVPLKRAAIFAISVGLTYGVLELFKYMANNNSNQQEQEQKQQEQNHNLMS